MSVISKDQLVKKIRKGEYKTAIIYDRDHRSMPQNMPFFERYDENSPEDLVQSMQEFYSNYSTWLGIFTVVLSKSPHGNISGRCLSRITCNNNSGSGDGGNQVQASGQAMNGKSYEQMYQEILAEIKTKMTISSLEAELKVKQAQLEETSTTAGRLGIMFEQFLMAKMGKKAPMFQNGATLQGTVEIENKDETKVSDEDFGKALIKIKDMFGVETLMNIANNYTKDDPNIIMIKNALNNGKKE